MFSANRSEDSPAAANLKRPTGHRSVRSCMRARRRLSRSRAPGDVVQGSVTWNMCLTRLCTDRARGGAEFSNNSRARANGTSRTHRNQGAPSDTLDKPHCECSARIWVRPIRSGLCALDFTIFFGGGSQSILPQQAATKHTVFTIHHAITHWPQGKPAKR